MHVVHESGVVVGAGFLGGCYEGVWWHGRGAWRPFHGGFFGGWCGACENGDAWWLGGVAWWHGLLWGRRMEAHGGLWGFMVAWVVVGEENGGAW